MVTSPPPASRLSKTAERGVLGFLESMHARRKLVSVVCFRNLVDRDDLSQYGSTTPLWGGGEGAGVVYKRQLHVPGLLLLQIIQLGPWWSNDTLSILDLPLDYHISTVPQPFSLRIHHN